jgi:hypothetical protein
MFTLIVRQILLAWVPFKRIHALCFLFTSPKIPHFHRSRALSFDGIIGNPDGGCVVAVDGGFGLWVAEVFERESKNHSFLAI